MESLENASYKSGCETNFEALMLEELRAIRYSLEDRAKKEAEDKQLEDASFNKNGLTAIINSNLVVSIFGGALTLPILSAESDSVAKRLVTASFLFFGTNTISCLFWLLRVTLPDQADLTDELSSIEKILLVVVGTIGHTLFNVTGLVLLAATAVTYEASYRIGLVTVGLMGGTALLYMAAGARHVARIPWSQILYPS